MTGFNKNPHPAATLASISGWTRPLRLGAITLSSGKSIPRAPPWLLVCNLLHATRAILLDDFPCSILAANETAAIRLTVSSTGITAFLLLPDGSFGPNTTAETIAKTISLSVYPLIFFLWAAIVSSRKTPYTLRIMPLTLRC